MDNKVRLYLLQLFLKDKRENERNYGLKKLETMFEAGKFLSKKEAP